MNGIRSALITLLAFSVFASSSANAATIWENPWNQSATNAGAFSQFGQQLAGEFVLADDVNVNSATWYGTMFSADPLNTGDTWSFLLSFYNIEAMHTEEIVESISVTALVTETAITIGNERAYQFDATYSEVGLSAGVSYWFSVVNTGTPNTFRWTESTSGTGTVVGNGTDWTSYSSPARTPLNFILSGDASSVPEPSTMLLLGSGLLGLVGLNRRRKA